MAIRPAVAHRPNHHSTFMSNHLHNVPSAPLRKLRYAKHYFKYRASSATGTRCAEKPPPQLEPRRSGREPTNVPRCAVLLIVPLRSALSHRQSHAFGAD